MNESQDLTHHNNFAEGDAISPKHLLDKKYLLDKIISNYKILQGMKYLDQWHYN